MAVGPYDAVAEKVLLDLEMAVKKDTSINEFDVIPKSEAENRNSSPILKGESSLGLESWIIPHIYQYAHNQIMQKTNYKPQNLEKVVSCLFGVVLLNPEMSTAWNRRRELILSRKMVADNELRLTRMALSHNPKSNEALAHRRWIITELLKNVSNKTALLKEELMLCGMIADRCHSNYHAWSHRMWSLQHLLPDPPFPNFKITPDKSPVVEMDDIVVNKFLKSIRDKYSLMVESELFGCFAEELTTNFKWVSSHVSDYSGFHFRQYLINQMLNFIRASLCTDYKKKYEIFGCITCYCWFFEKRRSDLIEFLRGFKNNNCIRKITDDFTSDLGKNPSLFEALVCIIISEIKSNHSLCLTFPCHEALWYYRRSLIHLFKYHVLDNFHSSEQTTFSHKDKNCVPHREDLKYDYTLIQDDQIPYKYRIKDLDLVYIFYSLLLKHEGDFIATALKSSDENEKKLARDYERWLKFYLKLNDKLF